MKQFRLSFIKKKKLFDFSIRIIGLTIFFNIAGCEVLDFQSDDCLLLKEEHFLHYVNTGEDIVYKTINYHYNRKDHLQVVTVSGKKLDYPYQDYLYTRDSVIIEGGKPVENFCYNEKSGQYRHEVFLYSDEVISKIEFWEYKTEKMESLKYSGIETLEYNSEDKIISSLQRRELDEGIRDYVSTTLNYENGNITELVELVWMEVDSGYEHQYNTYEGEYKEVQTFSNYDSCQNPYNGLEYLYNYRFQSQSTNNFRSKQIVDYDLNQNYAVYGSGYEISTYNPKDYPTKMGSTDLYYSCD